MSSYSLNTSASVTLDSNGNGTVQLTVPIGVTWNLTVAAVSTSTAVLNPTCSIYMGPTPTPDNLIDATYTGNQDATGKVAGFPLTKGQSIWAVWTGGDVGAVATLSLFGSVNAP